MATGVLVVCTGKATKTVEELLNLEKEYIATVKLGTITETEDTEGRVVETRPVPDFSEKEIEENLNCFIGEIEQVPSRYSAIKINGKPMYRWARDGVTLQLQPRKVRIHFIQLLSWRNPLVTFRIRCDRGTYIRALARDLGVKTGAGGYLTMLCRTAVGPYSIETALTPDEWREVILGHASVSIV